MQNVYSFCYNHYCNPQMCFVFLFCLLNIPSSVSFRFSHSCHLCSFLSLLETKLKKVLVFRVWSEDIWEWKHQFIMGLPRLLPSSHRTGDSIPSSTPFLYLPVTFSLLSISNKNKTKHTLTFQIPLNPNTCLLTSRKLISTDKSFSFSLISFL